MLIETNTLINLLIDNLIRFWGTHEELMKEKSMSKIEILCILLLYRHDKLSMGGICDNLKIPFSTATGMINRMVRDGYIERINNDNNRRTVMVSLTQKGSEITTYIIEFYNEHLQYLENILDEQEKEVLGRVIGKIVNFYSNME